MNRRGFSAVCFLTAAIFDAAWYLSAATYLAGGTTPFRTGLHVVGWFLPAMGLAFLAAGLVEMVHAELEERKKK